MSGRHELLELAVNPVPLERARVVTSTTGRARSFTPQRSEDFKVAFQWACRAAGFRGSPLREELAIHIEFWRNHRGNNRGDLDNLAKAVLDAGNAFLWVDDRQIVELHARIVASGPTAPQRIRLEIVEFVPTRSLEVVQ